VIDAEDMAAAMLTHPAPVIAVSEEVGLGVIPMNAVARSFVDALGIVNQITAARANRVVHVTAGLPHVLKDHT